jgi:hypothetical protein
MSKSATELMQDVLFSAVVESIASLKAGVKNAPNMLLRDINAIHENSTFADLPPSLQNSIRESARNAFLTMKKEGYSVSSNTVTQTRHIANPKKYPNPRASERSR